jgi:hypothetical protein
VRSPAKDFQAGLSNSGRFKTLKKSRGQAYLRSRILSQSGEAKPTLPFISQ